MTVLLTGGNNRLQAAVATRLVERGHRVRVLCTTRDPIRPWPAGVEPRDVAADDMAGVETGARGCDAAVVIDAGFGHESAESPPRLYAPAESTIAAVSRAEVGRLVFVRGAQSEQAVPFSGDVLVIEAADAYGFGVDAISRFLILMRSLPAVPLLNDRHVTRPLWCDDLAAVLPVALTRATSARQQTMSLVGPDAVTMAQLYERVATLVDRRPARIPVPDFLARYGARLADAFHLPLPFAAADLDSGPEVMGAGGPGGVGPDAFGVTPTPLEQGLRRLVDELDELTPLEGTGRVEVKRFSALIEGAHWDAVELLRQFRLRFRDVMPIDVGVEPVSGEALLAEGDTIALALPGRGHVQIRVQEVGSRHVVVSTIRGHALAGFVRFSTDGSEEPDGRVRFEVTTCDAAANALDWVGLSFGGARLQDANWMRVVHNVARLAGGSVRDARMDVRPLAQDEAEEIDRWVRGVIRRRRLAEAPTPSE